MVAFGDDGVFHDGSYDEFEDDEEMSHQHDDYRIFSGGSGGNDSGDGYSWFNEPGNPWDGRARLVPFTSDGIDFELTDFGESFPMPRAGARNSYAVDLGGDGVLFTGVDHNGEGYTDTIIHDEFSGHLYAVPRSEDPSNTTVFPHLAEHATGGYDHNHGDLNNDLRDYLDGLDGLEDVA